MAADENLINVEVAFAEPDLQQVIAIEVPLGATVADAIAAAGIEERFPQVAIDRELLGVWNRRRPPEHPLESGDRVEIYRPLIADPKEVRRQRAKENPVGVRPKQPR